MVFPYICRHFISTPSYIKQTYKIRHFPCHIKPLEQIWKVPPLTIIRNWFAKNWVDLSRLKIKWDDSRLQSTRAIPNNFYQNSVRRVVIKHMPSLNWNLNANKVVMICFLELADMCQHGLSQFWHVSAKLKCIKYILENLQG